MDVLESNSELCVGPGDKIHGLILPSDAKYSFPLHPAGGGFVLLCRYSCSFKFCDGFLLLEPDDS